MTREEEIKQADYISTTPEEREVWVSAAEWADAHPKSPWISVEERLPEKAKGLYELEKDEQHKMVLFKTATWKLFIGYLDAEEIWRAFTVPYKGACPIDSLTWSKVTHWMPIQQLSIEERLIDGLQELNEHFKKGE